ncbi:MAG: tyrosinase family protein, partial [Flavobacteriales bacterium]|nr:tyrosinase family protein [Flavobacteriales bacterium]
YVRKNANLPGAKEDLKALNIALEKMRKMECTNPLSWYSQGATHAIPATIPNGNPLCKVYTNIGETRWGWNTCTHQDGSEIHFLVWHRLYIWHFEKIVRELSGKKDFALPYWDYTDKKYRVMPKLLRDKKSALYEAARLDSLNNGFPVGKRMDSLLDVTKLFKSKVFEVFNNNIDKAPHGAMHNYIGDAKSEMWNIIYQDSSHPGLMAEVPSAGFDPVFWLHHSNIDYLWQKWENTANGSRPRLEELEAVSWPYYFYSPSKDSINYSMKQVYKTAFNPDYIYEGLNSIQGGIGTQRHTDLLTARKQHIKSVVWEELPNRKMRNGTLSHDPIAANDTKTSLLKSQEANTLDAIVIEITVQFDMEPDNFYDVYLVENGKKSHIGNMTFFGASHHAKMHKTDSNMDHSAPLMSQKFLFDITSESSLTDDFKIEISKRDIEDPELVISSIKLLSF